MKVAAFVLVAVIGSSSVVATELPSPQGCADYAKNKTGSDADCDAAIAKETDPKLKSVMLFRRAYMEDAVGDFTTYPKALADLDESIKAWPDNWQALHERGYLYNEYGRWKEAKADLDRQIELNPTLFDGYQERALTRFALGDLAGAEEDRNTAVVLDPKNPHHLIGRAVALMWLGRFDEARRDAAQAADLAKQANDSDTQKDVDDLNADIALWTKIGDPALSKTACLDAKTDAEYSKPTFIGDCTRTFLDAKTNKERADALTQRSTMMPVAKQTQTAGLDDVRIAYALDPDNTDHQFNLGSQLVSANRNREAIRYLDMAIKKRETHWAYSERASAKFNLGDVNGAFFDAKKSFEIEPDELALTILGDCFYAKDKKYDNAKIYWIGAYHLGDRDDGLIQRLKDAGVPIPPPDDPASTTAK